MLLNLDECPCQDALEYFYNSTQTGENNSPFTVLSKCYERLPDDDYRRMFLDAALLLRGRKVSHLHAVWKGQLLSDARRRVRTRLLIPRKHRADGSLETIAEHKQREQVFAGGLSSKMVARLSNLSLIQLDAQSRSVPVPMVHAKTAITSLTADGLVSIVET